MSSQPSVPSHFEAFVSASGVAEDTLVSKLARKKTHIAYTNNAVHWHSIREGFETYVRTASLRNTESLGILCAHVPHAPPDWLPRRPTCAYAQSSEIGPLYFSIFFFV